MILVRHGKGAKDRNVMLVCAIAQHFSRLLEARPANDLSLFPDGIAMLFNTAVEAMSALAANPRRLGARIGGLAILHTWGQALAAPTRTTTPRPSSKA